MDFTNTKKRPQRDTSFAQTVMKRMEASVFCCSCRNAIRFTSLVSTGTASKLRRISDKRSVKGLSPTFSTFLSSGSLHFEIAPNKVVKSSFLRQGSQIQNLLPNAYQGRRLMKKWYLTTGLLKKLFVASHTFLLPAHHTHLLVDSRKISEQLRLLRRRQKKHSKTWKMSKNRQCTFSDRCI